MKLTRIGKAAIACAAAVVVLASSGMTYAGLAGTINDTGKVWAWPNNTTLQLNDIGPVSFIWTESNDDGEEGDYTESDPNYTPVDPGDDGLDPSGNTGHVGNPPAPQQPGVEPDRYNKDVGFTAASIGTTTNDSDTINISADTAYPYYHPTVFFAFRNDHGDGQITSIILKDTTGGADIILDEDIEKSGYLNGDEVYVEYGGFNIGDLVLYQQVVFGSIGLEIQQAAQQDYVYNFELIIVISGEGTGTGDDGDEGCTPGFWKNHTCAWTGYNPGQILEDVFDVPDAYGLDYYNLLEALDFGGGPGAAGAAKKLLSHAVAALLNAAHPDVDYPLSESEIIDQVNDALASGNATTIENLKDTLDAYNNQGSEVCDDFGGGCGGDDGPTGSTPTPPCSPCNPDSTILSGSVYGIGGDEGCNPAFWLETPEVWEKYKPDTGIKSIFNLPRGSDMKTLSLSDALGFDPEQCSIEEALVRQAAAAALNEAHREVDYPMEKEEIVEQVNIALHYLSDEEIEELTEKLQEYNNLGSELCRSESPSGQVSGWLNPIRNYEGLVQRWLSWVFSFIG
jgi:hypothetical protein